MKKKNPSGRAKRIFGAFGANPFPQNLKMEKDGFENFGGVWRGGGVRNSNRPAPLVGPSPRRLTLGSGDGVGDAARLRLGCALVLWPWRRVAKPQAAPRLALAPLLSPVPPARKRKQTNLGAGACDVASHYSGRAGKLHSPSSPEPQSPHNHTTLETRSSTDPQPRPAPRTQTP